MCDTVRRDRGTVGGSAGPLTTHGNVPARRSGPCESNAAASGGLLNAVPFRRGASDSRGIMKPAKSTPLNGPHRELFADGDVSGEGRVKDGKRHGKWTWYHKNGGLKAVGKYAHGELDGYWEWWRESGKPLQAGSFDGGQQVGSWKRYYDNGQLWDEGDYDGGKKVGVWKVYNKNGELKQTKVFKMKK